MACSTPNRVDWNRAVDFGMVDDFASFAFHAQALSVSNNRTFWPEDSIHVWKPSESAVSISSTNANDTLLGTGARIIFLNYLDSSFVEKTLTANLNGLAGTITTETDIYRINSGFIISSGSGQRNAGIIYIGTGAITAGKPAVLYGIMPVGAGTLKGQIYTVPTGKSASFTANMYTSDGNKESLIEFEFIALGTNTYVSSGIFSISGFHNVGPFNGAFGPVPAGSDITARVSAPQSADLYMSTFFQLRTLPT